MYERAHHQRIAGVLERLDGGRLLALGCYFGGGTAIALRYGEYRESVDIDFLVSGADNYRGLRSLVRDAGLSALARPGSVPLVTGADVRIDQYGIRTWIVEQDVQIKFEIVQESRVSLASPGRKDFVCGVPSLLPTDLATCKLLAHVDRGLDDSTFNRDLIDLAMMTPSAAVQRSAVDKAGGAYGPDVVRSKLLEGIGRFRDREGWLRRCLSVMSMTVPEAVVWQKLRPIERRAAA